MKEGQPQIKIPSGELYFQLDASWEAIGEISTILMKGQKEVGQKVNDLMCESGIPCMTNLKDLREKITQRNWQRILSIHRRFDMMPNIDKEVVYYFVGKVLKEKEEQMRKDAINHASEDWQKINSKSNKQRAKASKSKTPVSITKITPNKIIFSGPKCIVLWEDGTKTIVSLSEKDDWNEYDAFCAALAKKIFGTTSAVHRIVDKKSNAKEFKEILKWKTKNLFNGLLSDLTDGLSAICKSFKKEGEDE